jgi:hypothetical protein
MNLGRPSNAALAADLQARGKRDGVLHGLRRAVSGRWEEGMGTVPDLDDPAAWRHPVLSRVAPHDLPVDNAVFRRLLDHSGGYLWEPGDLGRGLEHLGHVDMLAPRLRTTSAVVLWDLSQCDMDRCVDGSRTLFLWFITQLMMSVYRPTINEMSSLRGPSVRVMYEWSCSAAAYPCHNSNMGRQPSSSGHRLLISGSSVANSTGKAAR